MLGCIWLIDSVEKLESDRLLIIVWKFLVFEGCSIVGIESWVCGV